MVTRDLAGQGEALRLRVGGEDLAIGPLGLQGSVAATSPSTSCSIRPRPPKGALLTPMWGHAAA